MPSRSVYLDANVFIELWENVGTEAHRILWRMLILGMERDWRFVSSELSLAEVLVDPIAKAKISQDWSVVDRYRFQIYDKKPLQKVSPVTRKVLDMAANVRSENATIKLPDAIHLATALLENCSIFVTNDQRFGRALKRDLIPKPFEKVLIFPEIADWIDYK